MAILNERHMAKLSVGEIHSPCIDDLQREVASLKAEVQNLYRLLGLKEPRRKHKEPQLILDRD
jgi:hypothetical protein